MALNELFDKFEFLKTRIAEHREYLSSGGRAETRTRQVLIDPLLNELGWDVSDPRRVQLEYSIEKQYDVGKVHADYVLLGESTGDDPNLVAVIEAKKLGSNLLDKATNQVLNYANSKGIPWMVVTNGDQWEMYDVFKPVQLANKLRIRFVITDDSAAACALEALALWRPNLAEAEKTEDLGNARVPLLVPLGEPNEGPGDSGIENGNGDSFGEVEDSNGDIWDDWIPLTQVKYEGSGHRLRGSLKCPNGDPRPVRSWRGMYVGIASYLAQTGELARAEVPFGFTAGDRYAVARNATHPDGRPFTSEEWLAGGYVMETNNDAQHSLKFAIELVKKFEGGSNNLKLDDFKFLAAE